MKSLKLIDVTQNPLTIAVCEIGTVRLAGGLWHIDGLYQHRNRKRKRHLMRIEAQAERTIGIPKPGTLIMAVGRLTPAGSKFQAHIRADYAKVVTPGVDDMTKAFENAAGQFKHQLDRIQRRIERQAEYEELEAARRRLENAVCKLSN